MKKAITSYMLVEVNRYMNINECLVVCNCLCFVSCFQVDWNDTNVKRLVTEYQQRKQRRSFYNFAITQEQVIKVMLTLVVYVRSCLLTVMTEVIYTNVALY